MSKSKLSERAPTRTPSPKIIIDLDEPRRVSVVASDLEQENAAMPLATLLLGLLNLLERERKAAA